MLPSSIWVEDQSPWEQGGGRVSLIRRLLGLLRPTLRPVQRGAQRKGGLQAAGGGINPLPPTSAYLSAKTSLSLTLETGAVNSRRLCSAGHVYLGLRTDVTHLFLPLLILVAGLPPVVSLLN